MSPAIMPKWPHKAPLAPGHWRPIKRDGKPLVKVACPSCGAEGDLSEHKINANGGVTPSLICPNDCGFHAQVVLGSW